MSSAGAIALAPRVQRIKPSPSMVARERVRQLQAEGRDVIDLTAGEPDLDTPKHIRDAAAAALEAGETRYTPVNGTPALRKAIIAKLARENGVRYAMNEISVGGGAKQVIYNALAATLGAGDEVIIPAPYWVSYPDMVEACDGTPVIVSCGENARFKLSAEALEKAITPRTRWLILNSPCNPTGAFYSAAEIAALAEVLLRHPHVAVMTDDIYEHIRFDGGATPCIVASEPRLRTRTLLVNGVSKTYAMTGFRLGYGAGPAELIVGHEHDPVAVDVLHVRDQPGGGDRGARRRSGLRQRGPRDVSPPPRSCGRLVERHSRPFLPSARRRLLCVSVLRRPDRQDHARGQDPEDGYGRRHALSRRRRRRSDRWNGIRHVILSAHVHRDVIAEDRGSLHAAGANLCGLALTADG